MGQASWRAGREGKEGRGGAVEKTERILMLMTMTARCLWVILHFKGADSPEGRGLLP